MNNTEEGYIWINKKSVVLYNWGGFWDVLPIIITSDG